ncbi:MAG: AAA family ATPase, partial [Ferruginibacter sp.]|nr:AAA family ATPase [Ferruginibacter sp.]
TTQVNEENALINASKSTIKEYETSIARYMGMTNTNPGSEIKIKVIQTQLDMENKQLSNLKERSNQIAGLAKDDPTSNFIQTRLGQAAIEPNSKRTLVKMALSGFSVLFLASVFFLFLEIFDSSVKTPGIFNKLTKLKIATVVNKVSLKRKNAVSIIQEEGVGRKFIKENIFKNNIRKLRFELLNSGSKVFLFTSAQNGTGKSTIIEALATSLTHSNKKVLIMDMNFSNNSLTRFFETNLYIQDVIPQDGQQLNVEYNELAGKTLYANMYIIGCVERNTSPFEMFNSHQLNAFISQVKDKYDFILLEGASLNNYADSKELALSVDAVFTVFSADNAVTQIDKISNQFIAELKGKHYGVILNKVLTENINL